MLFTTLDNLTSDRRAVLSVAVPVDVHTGSVSIACDWLPLGNPFPDIDGRVMRESPVEVAAIDKLRRLRSTRTRSMWTDARCGQVSTSPACVVAGYLFGCPSHKIGGRVTGSRITL